jgi:hypothetical protein
MLAVTECLLHEFPFKTSITLAKWREDPEKCYLSLFCSGPVVVRAGLE